MKSKKPYQYMNVKGEVCTYIEEGKEYTFEFPATRARKEFKLPWGITGDRKGLKSKLL